ncbi:hypothetical protein HPB52_011880 [Rhipicephalus sanguineus]|uniref:Uncharacterized protein n=1 Tax=Rhipicephalus sanguineus TaxID=34632 RepID=A0A9D4Q9X8_RHISA|nr:hypothetical protein HPB52_011880 [Rhipicephalus sanguineus]
MRPKYAKCGNFKKLRTLSRSVISLLVELDAGASVSAVSEDTFRRKFQSAYLKPSTVLLRSYSGELTPA